jgi:hypothetical protein
MKGSTTPTPCLTDGSPAPVSDTESTTLARRSFLAAGGAGLATLAGCIDSVGRPADLDWVREEVDDAERERHQVFGPDDDAIFTVRQRPIPAGATAPLGFEALLYHREGLRTDSLRLAVLAPPRVGPGPAAEIAVTSPPNDRSTVTVTRDAGGSTTLPAPARDHLPGSLRRTAGGQARRTSVGYRGRLSLRPRPPPSTQYSQSRETRSARSGWVSRIDSANRSPPTLTT